MLSSAVLLAAFAALCNAHGVLVVVQGAAGSPTGVGFQVDPNLARNCTGISPCQQDTTLIRDAEISANIVNECGRTELTGNIDIGTETENQLAAGIVTQVTKGSTVAVTIHQVNADGAGPYVCDMDMGGNELGVSGQTNLTVTNNVPGVNGFSQAKTENFTINVQMPDNMACTGSSAGNVCTVRCRNNALAGPFGGCFAVQQTDTTASVNSANTIQTAQTLAGVTAQIAQNQLDLNTAVAANANIGSDAAVAAQNVNAGLTGLSVTSKAAPVQTKAVVNNAGAAVAATSSSAAAKATASAAAAKGAKGAAKGKDVVAKRDSILKWASRNVDSSME